MRAACICFEPFYPGTYSSMGERKFRIWGCFLRLPLPLGGEGWGEGCISVWFKNLPHKG